MQRIDDAIAAMDALLARAEDDGDPLGYFTCVYRAVTVRVRDGVRAGEFDDNERMERFDVLFAHAFLDAVDAHRAGRPVSASWRVALDAPSRFTLILQHLLAGMNAHINLDLGVAAALTQADGDVAELRDDFERLNDVLAAMVDRMQDALALVSPWSRLADLVGGRFDELVACWSITRARASAWELAERIAAAPAQRARTVEVRDRKVALVGGRILRPSAPTRAAVAVASLRERSDLRAFGAALREVSG